MNNKDPHRRAVILFTRIPVPGKTKTRMMPYLGPEECAELQKNFLRDISRQLRRTGADLFVCYTGGNSIGTLRKICGRNAVYIEQHGEGLGERMKNAFADVLKRGYESCVLTGSDIPELSTDDVNEALGLLEHEDIVIGPSEDGGYYLIGMSRLHPALFENKTYGHASVLEDLEETIRQDGLSSCRIRKLPDMDNREDLAGYRRRMRGDRRLRCSGTGRFLGDHATVSLIVPVYNEEKTIDHTARMLMDLRDKCEVIIVDGGSTDDTLAHIPEDLRLIHGPKGRALQMNAGASQAGGDILFFMHCDSELPKDPLGEIHRVMSKYEAGCFGIAFHSGHFFMLTNRLISNGRARCHGIMFGDQGIFMTRELFEEAGGFPELPIMEDYQLSLTLRKMRVRPGMTRRRIYTSDRRYPAKTIPKLKLMHKMYRLRKKYKAGVPADEIAKEYRDIR